VVSTNYDGNIFKSIIYQNHLEDQGVDGRIILNWIFRKWDAGARTGLIWFRIGTGGRLL
jgi:hypothetical protein